MQVDETLVVVPCPTRIDELEVSFRTRASCNCASGHDELWRTTLSCDERRELQPVGGGFGKWRPVLILT